MEELWEFKKRYNKANSMISRTATIKDCFYHRKKECRAPIKNAHSLQKQGSLKILELDKKGNKYLYAHTEREYNSAQDFLDLKPIGRKAASTFFGFCDKHDTDLFAPIENEPECTDINSDEHCFLHSYRSFAHSYHRKYEESKLYNTDDEETKALLLKMHGLKQLELMKTGVSLALRDVEISKKKLDLLIENKRYDELEYVAFEYPYTAPIACSALTSPHYTFSGEAINTGIRSNDVFSDVITTVLPFSNRTVVILAAFRDEPKSLMFLNEIDDIKYELLQQKFLSFHLINHSENCFLSPIWYENKPIDWRKKYCKMLDFIGDKQTPIVKFDKRSWFNYFSPTEAIR